MLDGAQHRVQRDDGLARADLPHQQPLHRALEREVAVDRVDRPLLVAGRLERQQGLEPAARDAGPAPPASRAPASNGRSSAAARTSSRRWRAAAQEVELDEQQLVERQPPAPALRVAAVGGEQRGGPVGQPLAGAQAPGQRLGRGARERQVLARPARGSGSTRAPRSPGSGRRRPPPPTPSVVGACEVTRKRLRASNVPCSTSRVPGRVLAHEPRLVEERRLHRARLVGDDRLDDRAHAAAAHRARGDRADLDGDGRLLALVQLGDGARLARSRGRCSSRSPTVSRPSAAAASRCLSPAPRSTSGALRAAACGPRHGAVSRAAASGAAFWAKAGGGVSRTTASSVTRRTAATSGSAGRPRAAPARRPRAPARRSRRRRAGAPSPPMTVTSSASLREVVEHGAQRLLRVAPGDELVVDVADGVADREASLRVVARGGRHLAGPQRGERLVHRGGVLGGRAIGEQRHGGDEPRLLLARGDDRDGLVGDLRGALGRHQDVGAVGEDDDLLGGDRVDARRGCS